MCKVFFDESTAASFNAYVYSPPTKKSKMNCGHFIETCCGSNDVKSTVPKVEVIKKAQTAQVQLLVQEQNCGFLNFQGEKLFFHGSQMRENLVSELETGDVLKFDVVYNPRTSAFLAKDVRRVESVRAKKNLGYFLPMMQVSETEQVSHQENQAGEVCQGRVTKKSAEHGFINEEVFFHYSALVGTHMSELEIGSCLSFKARMNKSNTRKVASNVQKIVQTPEIKTTEVPVIVTPELRVTSELLSIKNLLALEGANLLRRLSKNLIVNDQTDEEVEHIMHTIKVDALSNKRKNSLTPSFSDSMRTSRRGSAIGFR